MNRSYEHTAIVYSQVQRALHLRIPQSKARARRDVPVPTFHWPYFFGACAVSLLMWFAIVVGSFVAYRAIYG